MKFTQEFAAIDYNSEPKNVEKCKDTLKFLDYLRKSQCTMTLEGRNGFNHPFVTPSNDKGCEEVLKKMEEVASACIRLKR